MSPLRIQQRDDEKLSEQEGLWRRTTVEVPKDPDYKTPGRTIWTYSRPGSTLTSPSTPSTSLIMDEYQIDKDYDDDDESQSSDLDPLSQTSIVLKSP